MRNKLSIPISENDHRLNSLRAPINLVEYGDYECPYSSKAASVFSRLIEDYKSELCFVYRHYPLKAIHPCSEVAALAAEAAGHQGRFWEFHEQLYIHSEEISNEVIKKIALDLNLDMDLFTHDLERYELIEKVRADHHGGIKSGVQSTPTIFINGLEYDGPTNYLKLREAIDHELSGGANSSFL